jgi:hypothetical protein
MTSRRRAYEASLVDRRGTAVWRAGPVDRAATGVNTEGPRCGPVRFDIEALRKASRQAAAICARARLPTL